MSRHSPIELRSNKTRTKIQSGEQSTIKTSIKLTNQVRPASSKMSDLKTKTPPGTQITKTKVISENSTQSELQNDRINKIEEKINSIDQVLKSHSEYITQISSEIIQKGNQFESNLISMKADIENIRKFQMNTELQPCKQNSDMMKKIQYILRENYIDQTQKNYEQQIEQIQNKIEELEKNNKLIAEIICDVVNCAITTVKHLKNQYNNAVNNNEMEREIKSLRNEINKLNITIKTDEEKMVRMNYEIQVTSSKFMDANDKFNKYVMEHNRRNNSKNQTIITSAIIDSKSSSNQETPKAAKRSNIFSNRELVNKRFTKNPSVYDYTRSIKVTIRQACVYNIDKFIVEFTEIFEKQIGKGIVKQVAILKYNVHQTIVNKVEIIVSFIRMNKIKEE